MKNYEIRDRSVFNEIVASLIYDESNSRYTYSDHVSKITLIKLEVTDKGVWCEFYLFGIGRVRNFISNLMLIPY